jgi:hypothetical protein
MKATYARNLTKPVKVALRTKDKVAKTPDESVKLIKGLKSGFHTGIRGSLTSKARD